RAKSRAGALASPDRLGRGDRPWPAAGGGVPLSRAAAGDRRSGGGHPAGAVAPWGRSIGMDSAAERGAVSRRRRAARRHLVHLELNPALLRARAHATIAISHASIVAPFTLGAAISLLLYPILSHQGVPFTSYALFMGVAMSITAFPVLARILHDRGIENTGLGVMALGCAAIDDVTAWCLLAFVVGVAQARLEDALLVTLLALAFIA